MTKERGMLERLFQYIRTTLSSPATSKEVAIFKNSSSLMEKFKVSHNSYYKRFSKAYKKTLLIMILSGLVQLTAFVITQAYNLAAVFAKKLAIGQFTLYFQQSLNLVQATEGVLDNYSSMNARVKSIDQYIELLEYPNSISQLDKPVAIPKKPSPPVIEFKNVSFKYPHSDKYALKNINLKIPYGQNIALMGGQPGMQGTNPAQQAAAGQ